MWTWDYKIKGNWQPQTAKEWSWFLVRKINYGDFKGLKKEVVVKYLPRIKQLLDPGKRAMLEDFFKTWS